jgi:pimeloyl-ACP methyl ester carboxylesterase
LLSWALFGKNHDDLLQWEKDELAYIYRLVHERYDITFAEGHAPHKVPRRLTLEDVSPWHRPLLVYTLVYGFNTLGGALWRLSGFRRYTTTNGLIYWHAAPRNATTSTSSRPPLLFFHGIAPGGLTVYLPMLLFGLGCKARNRHVFLFENPPIACQLAFDAHSEDETVEGVVEALDRHLQDGDKASPVTLCGHSFGSCPLTWLLASPQMRPRIGQLVLVDPVTILLSEPDVMNNFLYSRQEPSNDELPSVNSSFLSRLIAWWRRSKIHIVASSELCTEHYLRRHFSWYNSELWLEDIPEHVKVLVCLSEGDEIIHTKKVVKEIELYNSKKRDSSNLQVILWEGVGHAHCIMSSQNWEEIASAIEEQEGHVKMGGKVKTM